MQYNMFKVKIIQELPYAGTSADLKRIGIGDDGNHYALKTLNDSALLPISEWIGYHLCRAVGVNTPDFSVVELTDGALAFGSKWDGNTFQVPKLLTPIDAVNHFQPVKSALECIYAVDAFLPNEDRHARNILMRSTPSGTIPLAFDFSRASLMLGLPFGSDLTANCKTLEFWRYFKHLLGLRPCARSFATIQSLPDDWLEHIIASAPTSWSAGFPVQDTVDFWKNDRGSRGAAAQALL